MASLRGRWLYCIDSGIDSCEEATHAVWTGIVDSQYTRINENQHKECKKSARNIIQIRGCRKREEIRLIGRLLRGYVFHKEMGKTETITKMHRKVQSLETLIRSIVDARAEEAALQRVCSVIIPAVY